MYIHISYIAFTGNSTTITKEGLSPGLFSVRTNAESISDVLQSSLCPSSRDCSVVG